LQIRQFVKAVTDDYTISNTNVQVGVMTVSDIARIAFTMAQTNASNLGSSIDAVTFDGNNGQHLVG
jgi:hypothetical protein